MEVLFALLGLGVCILASAAYSGSEIGFYGLSRTRVDLEARVGRRSARWSQRLMRDDSALLITILIGNNLALELAGRLGARALPSTGSAQLDALLVTLALTPVVFLFGEALPKDLFRRRPHVWIARTVGFIAVSRVVFWPIERMLRGLSYVLERAFGLGTQAQAPARGREVMLAVLAEGRRSGVLHERAEVLARNALELRGLAVERAMVPWERVESLPSGLSSQELYERVVSSSHTRLPVVEAGPEGPEVLGYLHQLDVLEGGEAAQACPVPRPLARLEPGTPVDRALLTLRASGTPHGPGGQGGPPGGLGDPQGLGRGDLGRAGRMVVPLSRTPAVAATSLSG